MRTNAPSDGRNGIVDLTLDSDDDEHDFPLPTTAYAPLGPTMPLSASNRPAPAFTPRNLPTSAPVPPLTTASQEVPKHSNLPARQAQSFSKPLQSPNRAPKLVSVSGAGSGSETRSPRTLVPVDSYGGAHDALSSQATAKRRKIVEHEQQKHAPGVSTQPRASAATGAVHLTQHAKTCPPPHERIDQARRPLAKGMPADIMNKTPSVQYMNAALKANGATTSLLDKVAASGPRPIQIGRMSNSGDIGAPSDNSTNMSDDASYTPSNLIPSAYNNPQGAHGGYDAWSRDGGNTNGGIHTMHNLSHMQAQGRLDVRALNKDVPQVMDQWRTPFYFSGPVSVPQDDKDSVMSDASVSVDLTKSRKPAQATADTRPLVPATATQKQSNQQPTASKSTSQFSEEEEHFLIFLKEVKRLPWKQITTEFQKYYPPRVYHTLQSRYTLKINKRDRSQDPPTLKLPPQWAEEAVIDWPTVHADNSGPRERAVLHQDAGTRIRPEIACQTTDHDYSSGTDSNLRQKRPRRAPPVNYDVRRRFKDSKNQEDGVDLDELITGASAGTDTMLWSRSPSNAPPIAPIRAHLVVHEPLDMDFDAEDAGIALKAGQWLCGSPSQKLPYLEASQRSLLKKTPDDWEWDQHSSLNWQGMVLHVDFSPVEIAEAKRTIAEIRKTSQKSRHSTRRRQLRAMLRSMTEPQIQNLVHTLHRRLPARDRDCVAAFLCDALVGKVAEAPQILRLSAVHSRKIPSTAQADSTLCMIRQRELGLQSRRGWRTASKTPSYQVRNMVMDTLGPLFRWTGASSDIHTVAWSQEGDHFAVGAVTVTDQDSMQYNRPNNLLFGNLPNATIQELAEHSIERKRTETGANSSHAMFVSQDPQLYTTVTSVAFAPSGKVMYSAGYDKTVCVWDQEPTSSRPALLSKFRHKAEVELMTVNHNYAGVLATGSKRTNGSAIKLITLDEDDPVEIIKHDFHSAKAISRSDLKILPQALKFEPKFGEHLLAGFGANVREDNGFDTTGDLCLWDITTQSQISIHGSNRNIFDVAFNPNPRCMPSFAAGCVAGAAVNRGTRSLIRLYEQRSHDKLTCPLEIECNALDMNDIVWSPHDEHLLAAGCTDGRVYVWDLRNSDVPLRTLSHGQSLMPLQDGIPHECTDTGVRFLSWGDSATRLYSGSSDGVVKVWDVTRSEEDAFIKDIITFDSGIMAGAFSPDYTKLALGEVNGSVNILDVGRDDCTIKDAAKLQYVPDNDAHFGDNSNPDNSEDSGTLKDSGIAVGKYLLQTRQLQLAPMGNLPIVQVVQGFDYAGPFDQGVDAPFLREQAMEFQLNMAAKPGPQCTIPKCKDSIVKVTSEEFGDSGRSKDRIPDELRQQLAAIDASIHIIPGKSKCTCCGRPAQPAFSSDSPGETVLCERCSFACFRCGSVNAVAPATTTLTCNSCGGKWEIGALGYEIIAQPASSGKKLHVPTLRAFGRQILDEEVDGESTSYGDEMNALTDYYFSLAIDRPDSPPL
jgi:WD40 repeat protein